MLGRSARGRICDTSPTEGSSLLTTDQTRIKSVGIIPARGNPAAVATAAEVTDYLAERGIAVLDEVGLTEGERADLLLVLGGDGSILRAARGYPGMPILGINFGQVGFLAVVEQSDWRRSLDRVLAGDCIIRDEPAIDVAVHRAGRSEREALGWFMNDVVVRSRGPMLHIELYLSGNFLNVYPGDGLIVATPLGSSAYNMAANGPILLDGLRALAVTPICCHSPLKVSLVAPLSADIDLTVARGTEGILWMDGLEATALDVGDTVEIRDSPHHVRLVTFPETTYLDAFASKFEYQIRRGWRPSREPRE
ncbi:MAG: NAD(+)/NADH kinase [Chloroflexota bacterium]